MKDLYLFFSFMKQAPVDPLVILLLHFLALLQKKHFLPDAAVNLLLHFFYIHLLQGSLSSISS